MQDALTHIDTELTRCLKEYPRIIEQTPDVYQSQVRAELNHRYLCLQTAAWIIDQKRPRPGVVKPDEEVSAALVRWQKDIQKNSTAKSMHADGRIIAALQLIVDALKPITAQPEQKEIF